MIITHHGQNSFRVTSGNFTLLSDPINDRAKPDLILKTIINPTDLENPTALHNKIFATPGEFEINEVYIKGLQVKDESTSNFVKTVFKVKGIDDIRLAFLGHLSDSLNADIVDELGDVDILFLPIGGSHYLSPDHAAKVAKLIEPRVIIPAIHDQNALKDFSSILGQDISSNDKLTIKAKDIAEWNLKVIALKKS